MTRGAHPRWFPTLAIAIVLLAADVRGQDPSSLFDQVTYPVGSNPQGGVAADLDGDGDLDLAVANRFGSSVAVLPGDGSGAFGSPMSFSVGSQPMAVAAGDFDGDGVLDLAVANSGSSSVSVLSGQGGGAFGAASSVLVPALPVDVAAGDLDGDGIDEIVVAHDTIVTPISILWSTAPGSAVPADTGFCSSSVALGDLDDDGQLDIVVNDCLFHAVRAYRNLGGGSLAAAVSWPVLLDPRDVALADVDEDGALDVAAVCQSADSVCVVLGNGDGTFASSADFATGVTPVSVAVGDFDADGSPDLVTANFGSSDVSLLLGDGTGSFGSAHALAAGFIPANVVAADTSGDGVADFTAINAFSNDATVFTSTAEPALGPWVDLGGAVAGREGEIELTVEGDPIPGQVVTFTAVTSQPSKRRGVLIIGMEDVSKPFKGGVMVPSPDRVLRIRLNQPKPLIWPDLAPGESLFIQAWVRPKARQGIASASNALQGITR